jgi:hypothetical protein
VGDRLGDPKGQANQGHSRPSSAEGGIRTSKESERARGTHFLGNVEEETSQETKRNPADQEHLQTGQYRERNKSKC